MVGCVRGARTHDAPRCHRTGCRGLLLGALLLLCLSKQIRLFTRENAAMTDSTNHRNSADYTNCTRVILLTVNNKKLTNYTFIQTDQFNKHLLYPRNTVIGPLRAVLPGVRYFPNIRGKYSYG
ncbi:hypothetical protein K1T71_012770 [Dendrolimus kikuchii]|uniref:Uncharacterized protein n=1 Tax=Dendrolimus kikuchii TaxID=765133 RepID=A0ACC1CKC5_9NEOP|nr:hypothetical protein K1T71_012770 [Dendrolimus kikuchii]